MAGLAILGDSSRQLRDLGNARPLGEIAIHRTRDPNAPTLDTPVLAVACLITFIKGKRDLGISKIRREISIKMWLIGFDRQDLGLTTDHHDFRNANMGMQSIGGIDPVTHDEGG